MRGWLGTLAITLGMALGLLCLLVFWRAVQPDTAADAALPEARREAQGPGAVAVRATPHDVLERRAEPFLEYDGTGGHLPPAASRMDELYLASAGTPWSIYGAGNLNPAWEPTLENLRKLALRKELTLHEDLPTFETYVGLGVVGYTIEAHSSREHQRRQGVGDHGRELWEVLNPARPFLRRAGVGHEFWESIDVISARCAEETMSLTDAGTTKAMQIIRALQAEALGTLTVQK